MSPGIPGPTAVVAEVGAVAVAVAIAAAVVAAVVVLVFVAAAGDVFADMAVAPVFHRANLTEVAELHRV